MAVMAFLPATVTAMVIKKMRWVFVAAHVPLMLIPTAFATTLTIALAR